MAHRYRNRWSRVSSIQFVSETRSSLTRMQSNHGFRCPRKVGIGHSLRSELCDKDLVLDPFQLGDLVGAPFDPVKVPKWGLPKVRVSNNKRFLKDVGSENNENTKHPSATFQTISDREKGIYV